MLLATAFITYVNISLIKWVLGSGTPSQPQEAQLNMEECTLEDKEREATKAVAAPKRRMTGFMDFRKKAFYDAEAIRNIVKDQDVEDAAPIADEVTVEDEEASGIFLREKEARLVPEEELGLDKNGRNFRIDTRPGSTIGKILGRPKVKDVYGREHTVSIFDTGIQAPENWDAEVDFIDEDEPTWYHNVTGKIKVAEPDAHFSGPAFQPGQEFVKKVPRLVAEACVMCGR